METDKDKKREEYNAYMRAYYQKNKDKVKEYYQREDVKAARAEYYRKYRELHSEEIKEYNRLLWLKRKEKQKLREQEEISNTISPN